MSIEQATIVIPSDPALRGKIKDAINEISNQKTIIEGYQANIKEIIENISEEADLPAKFIRKAADVYHRQNFDQQQQEQDDFQALYETVIGE